jgi:hypothetical protein
VGDVLAEERPSRLAVPIVILLAGVAQSAGAADPVQQRLVDLERGEIEHPPVPPGHADRRVYPVRREAVIPGMGRDRIHR